MVQQIQKEWLTGNGFHEMEAGYSTSTALLDNDKDRFAQLKDMLDDGYEMTHAVAVNLCPATPRMPVLTVVVVDTIPGELKRSYMVWSWLIHVLLANLLLVVPLVWLAA